MTRKETILKLIVEHFIKTAQPVGSQTLLDEYGLTCSSATIRNEMNALEKDGMLEKTHASSGRVPSSEGYRYYVEHLRDDRVDNRVKFALASVLEKRTQSVEEVIEQSCQILSSMTNLASVVLGPKVSEEKLVSVQVIPLSPTTATAVFVTDQGYVENKTFVLEQGASSEEVQKTVTLLNDRLKGTPIVDLVPKMEAMRPAVTDYVVGQDVVYQALMEAFLRFAGDRLNLYGKDKLFEQPEFADDAKKLRKVLSLLDDPKALREALQDVEEEPKCDENVDFRFAGEEQDLAIVSAKVNVPGGQSTSISLVGPTRMDYDSAVGMLRYVAKTLDEYFKALEGGNEECPKKTTSNPSKPTKKKAPKKS
ncbi:MAG: heat-inducible transcriptional repressor HrcA [Bacilli bacterium]|nr:heat-inducible transcriptional repressor HrcA [Bacilli bacterium]